MFSLGIKSIIFSDFFVKKKTNSKVKRFSRRQMSTDTEWRYWPDHLKKDIGFTDVSVKPDARARFNMMF